MQSSQGSCCAALARNYGLAPGFAASITFLTSRNESFGTTSDRLYCAIFQCEPSNTNTPLPRHWPSSAVSNSSSNQATVPSFEKLTERRTDLNAHALPFEKYGFA